MKKSWLVFAVFLLGGCAKTLEDFQEMSSQERTRYVCEEHREVRKLSSRTDDALQLMRESEEVVQRGYRVHKSCKKIPYFTEENCSFSEEGVLTCKKKKEYETVCEEVPVAIDADLEKEKLRSHERDYEEYGRLLREKVTQCRDHVQDLGAEEAFDYYQRVK